MSAGSPAHIADACAIIVFVAGSPIRPATRDIMETGDIWVSPVTVWEVTRKASLGLLPNDWGESGLAAHQEGLGFRPLPLLWIDAEVANHLPPLHKDPMDRLLIAQALRNDMTVITSDRIFAAYGVRTLW